MLFPRLFPEKYFTVYKIKGHLIFSINISHSYSLRKYVFINFYKYAGYFTSDDEPNVIEDATPNTFAKQT
jgi:hypothetical protein